MYSFYKYRKNAKELDSQDQIDIQQKRLDDINKFNRIVSASLQNEIIRDLLFNIDIDSENNEDNDEEKRISKENEISNPVKENEISIPNTENEITENNNSPIYSDLNFENMAFTIEIKNNNCNDILEIMKAISLEKRKSMKETSTNELTNFEKKIQISDNVEIKNNKTTQNISQEKNKNIQDNISIVENETNLSQNKISEDCS